MSDPFVNKRARARMPRCLPKAIMNHLLVTIDLVVVVILSTRVKHWLDGLDVVQVQKV